jgi:alpha-methylacyl-CoA racemase
MPSMSGDGPLRGLRVLEFGGIGPGPFAAMMLADMGAEVLRIERPGTSSLFGQVSDEVVTRGRPALELDLRDPVGVGRVLATIDRVDALIEGFRPGVMERLGLGPEQALLRNPRLVYGRVTGYGQSGPLAQVAGHDVNYIALAGVLGAIARRGERPLFPLNLVGDYGGGGMLLAFGILCGLLEARTSGRGQVVDAAMVDGAALQSALIHGLRAAGMWSDEPGTNVLDSGAHFYEVYETADGRYVAVGALEPKFYAVLLELLELDPAQFPQWDRGRWSELKLRLAAVFRTRTAAEWSELLESTDACAMVVLGLGDATLHPHNLARETFTECDGVTQPAPAPRFSRTPGRVQDDHPSVEKLLETWGVV